MKNNKPKQYYVTDQVFINNEPVTVAVEMWTAQDIIDTIIERKKIGWYSNIYVAENGNIEITNNIVHEESEDNNE